MWWDVWKENLAYWSSPHTESNEQNTSHIFQAAAVILSMHTLSSSATATSPHRSRMPTKSNNIGGRGGARPGAGRKKSAVKEKANNGNPGGRRLEVLDIPDVEGVEMPKPHDFLSAEQRDGSELQASEIYEETWQWLKKIGCASKVSPQLLERYAMCSARWIQCEEMTNMLGRQSLLQLNRACYKS